MNHENKIGVQNSNVVHSNRSEPTTLSGYFQKRKLMWIICSIVSVGLIITISIIILKTKKTNSEMTSTMITVEESTIEITEGTELISITTEKVTTKITETKMEETTAQALPPVVIVNFSTKWKQDPSTVAGGNWKGNQLNQLISPNSIYVDDDQSIYISDLGNHRIVRWKSNSTNGEVVAGGNRNGSRLDQLSSPTDAILDQKTNSLVICDAGNRRVIRWFRRNVPPTQQIVISNIVCFGLAIDKNGDLYVSDWTKDEVSRWKQGDTNGTKVAGGNGKGSKTNQLNTPYHVFVDEDYSVYVADHMNSRVMKWTKGAEEGVVVASGRLSVTADNYPLRLTGVIVDHMGNIYASDKGRCPITRWLPGTAVGNIVVGETRCGGGKKQFDAPYDLSFDRWGNLYVVDMANHRVQKFTIEHDEN